MPKHRRANNDGYWVTNYEVFVLKGKWPAGYFFQTFVLAEVSMTFVIRSIIVGTKIFGPLFLGCGCFPDREA